MSLTVKKIAKLLKPGRYLDAHGLYLQVMSPTNRSWLFRYELDGRERFMGLGPLHTITLAEARERAREARKLLLGGVDPIEARHAARDALRKEETERIIFKDAAEQFLSLHENGWRNAKHRQQWRNTLKQYAYPKLGMRPVKMIDTALINDAVAAIWQTKPETAGRVRLRIERVLRWVKEGKPLPTQGASRRTKNHAALPYRELPFFVAELREREGISARALEFLILTAARTGEVIGAKWPEIDLDGRTWTIPDERMKAGREHRVPLSDRAIEILKALPREKGNDHVFIGASKGKQLSNMAMLEMMRGMRPGYVPHGFRSCFKDWASETTNHPNIVSEMALAHTVQGVEGAYRRGDLLQKRARLMRDWAKFATTKPVTGNVVPLKRQAAE